MIRVEGPRSPGSSGAVGGTGPRRRRIAGRKGFPVGFLHVVGGLGTRFDPDRVVGLRRLGLPRLWSVHDGLDSADQGDRRLGRGHSEREALLEVEADGVGVMMGVADRHVLA